MHISTVCSNSTSVKFFVINIDWFYIGEHFKVISASNSKVYMLQVKFVVRLKIFNLA